MNGNQPHRPDFSRPLMTAADVAELLGFTRSSVYDYARRENEPLPSLQIGRHRRFQQEDVEAWLRDQRAA